MKSVKEENADTRGWASKGALVFTSALVASVSFVCGSCGEDDDPDAGLFETVVETQELEVGRARQVVSFGSGNAIELEIPQAVVAQPARIRVQLVTGTVQRGRTPVGDSGLLVRPRQLVFDRPVRVRMRVPPPPLGRVYSSVVVPDDKDEFVVVGRARRLASEQGPGQDEDIWEGEGTGSGLWGLALIDADEAESLSAGSESF